MEVARFKEQKHSLFYYMLFESEIDLATGTRCQPLNILWFHDKGSKRKLFALRHHLSWKGFLKTQNLEAFAGVQMSLIWSGRLFHSWILTTKGILSQVLQAVILGFANCTVPDPHTRGTVHSPTQPFHYKSLYKEFSCTVQEEQCYKHFWLFILETFPCAKNG